MKYLIKYASRSRPENFERGLISIIENANEPKNIVVLVSLDIDDKRLPEYMTVIEKYWSKVHIKVKADKSNNKIHAINRDINDYKAHWDILINFSDDMIFTMKGWDDFITEKFKMYFPNGDGFLHLNDGNQSLSIATMSVMDRKYYDRDEYIYHPDYESLECDREATDVAHIRGRKVYIKEQLIKHLHYEWGLAPNDPIYAINSTQEIRQKDKDTFNRRKAVNYGLGGMKNKSLYL